MNSSADGPQPNRGARSIDAHDEELLRAGPAPPPLPPFAPIGASQPLSRPKIGKQPPSVQSASKPNADSPLSPGEQTEKANHDELSKVAKEAQPWMVSLIVHLLAVIVMALIHVRHNGLPNTNEVEAELESTDTLPDNPVFAEKLGEQLKDPNSPDEGSPENGDQAIITPQDPNLPLVESAFAAPPQLAFATAGPGTIASSNLAAPEIGLALKGRMHGRMKNTLIGRYGGNALTSESVHRGLNWLVKNQLKDGLWSLSGPFRDGSTSENQVAATGLALLALQGDGNTHREGEYSKTVAKGWKALLKLQEKDGRFGGVAMLNDQQLYSHAIATIAICELYGMTQDSQYREAAERAVRYAVKIQSREGGWRYNPGSDSDLSVTGWFVIALQSARMAKLDVPPETFEQITKLLDRLAIDGGRAYEYTPGRRGQRTYALKAEGLLCREFLGWKQDDKRLVEGVSELLQNPIDYEGTDRNVYYWYYATQATHHLEGDVWKKWNDVMRQEVPSHQVRKGQEAGSWDPGGDQWGPSGGRLYTTCLSIFMLEVYYRHLPIYTNVFADASTAANAEADSAPE